MRSRCRWHAPDTAVVPLSPQADADSANHQADQRALPDVQPALFHHPKRDLAGRDGPIGLADASEGDPGDLAALRRMHRRNELCPDRIKPDRGIEDENRRIDVVEFSDDAIKLAPGQLCAASDLRSLADQRMKGKRLGRVGWDDLVRHTENVTRTPI